MINLFFLIGVVSLTISHFATVRNFSKIEYLKIELNDLQNRVTDLEKINRVMTDNQEKFFTLLDMQSSALAEIFESKVIRGNFSKRVQ